MSKSTITKLFIGSLIGLAGGLILLVIAGALAYANGSFVMSGPDVVGVRSTPFGWVMLALAGVALLVVIGATITQFIAWIAAVLNTAALQDKTWFIVLLVTGLLSFGFVGMIAYLIAGPDSTQPAVARPEGPMRPAAAG